MNVPKNKSFDNLMMRDLQAEAERAYKNAQRRDLTVFSPVDGKIEMKDQFEALLTASGPTKIKLPFIFPGL